MISGASPQRLDLSETMFPKSIGISLYTRTLACINTSYTFARNILASATNMNATLT
jgi:hypothetical protein